MYVNRDRYGNTRPRRWPSRSRGRERGRSARDHVVWWPSRRVHLRLVALSGPPIRPRRIGDAADPARGRRGPRGDWTRWTRSRPRSPRCWAGGGAGVELPHDDGAPAARARPLGLAKATAFAMSYRVEMVTVDGGPSRALASADAGPGPSSPRRPRARLQRRPLLSSRRRLHRQRQLPRGRNMASPAAGAVEWTAIPRAWRPVAPIDVRWTSRRPPTTPSPRVPR